jgi:hypothetical protein
MASDKTRDRQTDMTGLMECTLLMIEHKDRLKEEKITEFIFFSFACKINL